MNRELFREGIVREIEGGVCLVGKRCTKCGHMIFPIGKFCTQCLNEETEEMAFGQTGTLFSFTTTYGPVSKREPPLAVGYIETDDGVRVFAPLHLEEDRPFEIGMKMKLEIADLWEEDDVAYTGYQYRIAD